MARAIGSSGRCRKRPQGIDRTQADQIAWIIDQRSDLSGGLLGAEMAEGSRRHGSNVFMRVLKVADQSRNRRRTDHGQDRGQLIPLLLGQRCHFAQRHEERPDHRDSKLGKRIACTIVNRLVWAPKIRDRFRQELALAYGRKHLLEEDERKE
jgi:hypothetical protein